MYSKTLCDTITNEVKNYMREYVNNSQGSLADIISHMDYNPIVNIMQNHLGKKLLIPSIGEIVYLSSDMTDITIFMYANYDLDVLDNILAKIHFEKILAYCVIC